MQSEPVTQSSPLHRYSLLRHLVVSLPVYLNVIPYLYTHAFRNLTEDPYRLYCTLKRIEHTFELRYVRLLAEEIAGPLIDSFAVPLLFTLSVVLHLLLQRSSLRLYRSRSPLSRFVSIYLVPLVFATLFFRQYSSLSPHGSPAAGAVRAGVFLAVYALCALSYAVYRRITESRAIDPLPYLAGILLLVYFVPILVGLAAGRREPKESVPDIMLIITDTLRYDAGLEEAFNIDGVSPLMFSNVYSTSPWTSPSVISIFSGLYPHEHGVIADLTPQAPPIHMIHEVLANRGYRTLSFQTNTLLREWSSYTFDEAWYEYLGSAGTVMEAVRDRLGRQDGPVFCYIHLMDPHMPYPEASQICPGSPVSPHMIRENIIETARKGDVSHDRLADCMVRYYRQEVGYMLDQLRGLFLFLEDRGNLDNTLILLVADHGEEFWDHGLFEHGHSMYDELLHVPMMIHVPDDFAGAFKQVDSGSLRSTIDIVPTLEVLLNLTPNSAVSGIPLMQPSPEDRTLFAEYPLYGQEISAAITGEWKWIHYLDIPIIDFPYSPDNPAPFKEKKFELFDRRTDPKETISVEADHPGTIKQFVSAEQRFKQRNPYEITLPERTLSEEARKKFKSLGYIQ